MDWTTVLTALEDYWILVGIAAFLIGWTLYLRYKKSKRIAAAPKVAAAQLQAQAAQPAEREPESTPENTFAKFGVEKKEEKKDVLLSIQELNSVMNTNTAELDSHMLTEFERLKKQLAAVHARKEYIRKYGMELSKLFDKHRESEAYLTNMLSGMGGMIQKQKQIDERKPKQPQR